MHYNSLPYSSIKWPPRNKQPTCIKFPLPIALFTWKFLHWVEKENIKGQPITKVLRSIDLTYNACSWLSETSRVRFGFWKCWQKVSINFRVLSIPEHLFSNMDIQYNYFMSPLFPNHGCLMHNHCCDYITERKGSATLLSMLYTYRIPVVTLCVVLAHPSTSSCPSMKCTCLGGRTEKVGVPGGRPSSVERKTWNILDLVLHQMVYGTVQPQVVLFEVTKLKPKSILIKTQFSKRWC